MISDFYDHPHLYDAIVPVSAYVPLYGDLARQAARAVLETLWYYGAVADGLRDALAGHALHAELDAAVFELKEVVSPLWSALIHS